MSLKILEERVLSSLRPIESAGDGRDLLDPVRASFLKPAFQSIIDFKRALGEKPHDAQAALSQVLLK